MFTLWLVGVISVLFVSFLFYRTMLYAAREAGDVVYIKYIVLQIFVTLIAALVPLGNIVVAVAGLLVLLYMWWNFILENDDPNSWWNKEVGKRKTKE